jgi:hypothetical protein
MLSLPPYFCNVVRASIWLGCNIPVFSMCITPILRRSARANIIPLPLVSWSVYLLVWSMDLHSCCIFSGWASSATRWEGMVRLQSLWRTRVLTSTLLVIIDYIALLWHGFLSRSQDRMIEIPGSNDRRPTAYHFKLATIYKELLSQLFSMYLLHLLRLVLVLTGVCLPSRRSAIRWSVLGDRKPSQVCDATYRSSVCARLHSSYSSLDTPFDAYRAHGWDRK